MNVQKDLKKHQLVTNFGTAPVVFNIGNHYDRTKGIFTASCDGLYLCSLTLRCEIGENIEFDITVKSSRGYVPVYDGCIVQTSTVNTSPSGITPLNLKQNDQMRPKTQANVISSQLKLLEELKIQLKSVLEHTDNAIQKGHSWMEGTNNETFFEMNKYLIDETSECVRRCQDIGKDKNEEKCHKHSDKPEQDIRDTKTKSVDTLKTSKPVGFDIRDVKEYQELFTKCQEMEKTISKNFRKLQKHFEKHKNETKDILCRERQEIENQYKNKWIEVVEEFQQASNFMSRLQTENEDVKKQMDSLQKQIKENEQKSETFIKQQKSTENSFSLRLDEVMKEILRNAENINKFKSDSETLSNVVNEHAKNFDTIIPNLQEKLKDLGNNFKAMESSCLEIKESNITKFDDNTIKSKELFDKILDVSSQVDTMSKELKVSRQQAGFFATAYGDMNVQMDLCEDQIVTSFGGVLNNTGDHYDSTKGIFTAPCDGFYLCSLSLRFDIGENVEFGIRVKESSGEEYKCILQTTTVNSSASVTGLLSLKQNDQLYIASVRDYQQIKLDYYSYLMCTLINKD